MRDNDIQSVVREAIQKIAVGPDRGKDLTREHACQVMQGILAGEVDELQAAIFLIALRMKRESMDEFLGLFDALRAETSTVIAHANEVICLADPFDGYVRTVTMTPFIPAVLASFGLNCVIHGVESVGPKHGVTAHKVFKLAGIRVDASTQSAADTLDQHGWTYVDQSQYAGVFYGLNILRDRVVKRTALTTLERLLLPIRGAQSSHLVLGYVHKAYPKVYATIAQSAGFQSALLVKGVEGGLAPALNKPLRRFFFKGALPADIDQHKEVIESAALFSSRSAALGIDASTDPTQQCLTQGIDVLTGRAGIARESLSLAAGQILFAHGLATSLAEAVENVHRCLDNGAAHACFESLIHRA